MWMNFYTKVLSKHAGDKNLKLKVTFEASPSAGISKEKIEETKAALRELGLNSGELKSEQSFFRSYLPAALIRISAARNLSHNSSKAGGGIVKNSCISA